MDNTRIEITIQPWAVSALDGSKLSSELLGLWFTKFNPMYSSVYAMETEAGKIVCKIPQSLLKLAIFEASKFTDAITGMCPDANQEYFKQIRWRYVTLRSILTIISESFGLGTVSRKALGDFEIEFDNRDHDTGLVNRLLKELARLEPIVTSGGCLGLGTSYGPQAAVKGATDPYRPVFGRDWYEPLEGEASLNRGKASPLYNYNSYLSDRWRNAGSRLTGMPRRGGP